MLLYLKIATVNCRGIRDRAKRLAFFTYARTLDVHVLCLQETFSKPKDDSVWQIDWGDKNQTVFNSNAEISGKTDADTAILLNQPSLQFSNVRKDSGGRILTAEVRCNNFLFQVLNVYSFTSSYPKQKREGFFNQIYDFAKHKFDKNTMWRLQLRGESNPRPTSGKKHHHFRIKTTNRVFAALQNVRLRNTVTIDKTHVFFREFELKN